MASFHLYLLKSIKPNVNLQASERFDDHVPAQRHGGRDEDVNAAVQDERKVEAKADAVEPFHRLRVLDPVGFGHKRYIFKMVHSRSLLNF